MSLRTDVLVQTEGGAVSGYADRGCQVFRGIPFAAAPFGENRFRYPQPVEPWDGVRDGSVRGVGAPQPDAEGDPLNAYFNPDVQGEDCLNLEIWTPDVTATGLPVMVWIHGGGYMTGSGSAPAHSGYSFARDGVVHVGINYRVGIEGFTYLGEGTDNLGLRDQVAALQWIQRNIATFGGDPSQVTIFGQSGGAVAVMQLLAMPASEGLFARAISMSGSSLGSVTTDDALEVTAKISELLGVPADRDSFAAVPVDQMVATTFAMGMDFFAGAERWGARSLMVSPYRAVHGTPSLPEPVLEAAARSTVPLLAGTATNEATGFLELLGVLGGIPETVATTLLGMLGADDTAQAAYRSRAATSDVHLVEAAWTDWAFRIPTFRLAERRTAPTWLYQFTWESPAYPAGLGANHALDVPFMRDDVATLRAIGPVGEQLVAGAPEQLAPKMHADWLRFATTGDPGWPAYEPPRRSTMIYGPHSTLHDDPAQAERLAWEGKR